MHHNSGIREADWAFAQGASPLKATQNLRLLERKLPLLSLINEITEPIIWTKIPEILHNIYEWVSLIIDTQNEFIYDKTVYPYSELLDSNNW